uniref:Transcription initiation factor TFIID subunit 3 n=1 Tax=Phallusia mammillata TaxID=59560 RepID=A0A6F9DV91_9ASCI|nr:transcription initiation factor TFIID subunit 3 [Phallusia mammillata]
MMAELFARNILRIVVAHYSQAIGFDSVHSCPLEVLTDILQRFLCQLGKDIHDFTEQCSHTDPHLNDVVESFNHNHVSVPELIDYLQQMDAVNLAKPVSKFPKPKSSNFQYPSVGHSHELKHVFSYSPSILHATENFKHEKKLETEQRRRSPMFTIAGKQDLSDDEEDVGSYASDVSLDADGRNLTKPEDIPIVSGTAASSLTNFPTPPVDDEISEKWENSKPLSTKKVEESKTQIKPGTGTVRLPSTSKTEEPFWVRQHAAKMEKESSKTSPKILTPAKAPNESKRHEDNHQKRKYSLDSHSKRETSKHSLWDSPIFSRKSLNPPVTTEAFQKNSCPKSAETSKSEMKEKLSKSTLKQTKPKISITSRIEEVERLLKDPIVKKTELPGTKPSKTPAKSEGSSFVAKHVKEIAPKTKDQDHSGPFASPKSMDDAINAVVNRISKEAEEAELMKFSHLIEDSSSSDEEEAVLHKTEEMLQLEKRGLHKHHEDESPTRPPLTPSPALSTNSLIIDQEMEFKTGSTDRMSRKEDASLIYTSDDSESDDRKWNLSSREMMLANENPSYGFSEPKQEKRDLVKSKSAKKSKKKSKSKSGNYDLDRMADSRSDSKHVQKLILKTSRAGDGKVMKIHKEKDIGSNDRERLPVPKLSASISVPVTSNEKKKERKDKKKKKQREKEKDFKIKSKEESPIPKLTFKMTSSDHHVSIVKPSKMKRPSIDDKVHVPAKKHDNKKETKSLVERKVITQTISVASAGVGVIIDAQGNQVWICPGCNKPDDGSPMIGCDKCDGWYHWPCVRITQEPPESEEWYCPSCAKQKQKLKKKNSKSKNKLK